MVPGIESPEGPGAAAPGEWVGAGEAARRLGIQRATLYSYVSRGVLHRRTGADGRASLFHAGEIEALARRGRPRHPGLGELVIESGLTEITTDQAYYRGLGWREDADFSAGPDFRVVQLTPPGSPCSVIFGTGITTADPGSARVVLTQQQRGEGEPEHRHEQRERRDRGSGVVAHQVSPQPPADRRGREGDE